MTKITVTVTEANYAFLRSQKHESYADTVNRVLEQYRDFGPMHTRFKQQLDRLDSILEKETNR